MDVRRHRQRSPVTSAVVTWTPSDRTRRRRPTVDPHADGHRALHQRLDPGREQGDQHRHGAPEQLAEGAGGAVAALSRRFREFECLAGKCVSEFTPTRAAARRTSSTTSTTTGTTSDLASTLRHTSLAIAGHAVTATVHTACCVHLAVITTNPQSTKCAPTATARSAGDPERQRDCWTTNVYEQGRWWLCDEQVRPPSRDVYSRGHLGTPSGNPNVCFRSSRVVPARRVVAFSAVALRRLWAASAAAEGHLRVSGTRSSRPDGSVFEWRGITAFRLLEFVAHGREAEADAYLAWAASKKLNRRPRARDGRRHLQAVAAGRRARAAAVCSSWRGSMACTSKSSRSPAPP